jgi:electron transport complex protein RnfB
MSPVHDQSFEPDSPYRRLGRSLDSLPNRFPPAEDESDLRLLAKLFSPQEAGLAADLRPEKETAAQICARLGRDAQEVNALLKAMSKKGLIAFGKTADGRLGFGLMPFVVGFYEEQGGRMDAELAHLFDDYFRAGFGRMLEIQPQVHRVVPVGVSIKNTMEVHPYESATGLVERAKSWGVTECICRKQKALVGEPCGHPLDVCMILGDERDAFHNTPTLRVLTRDEALQTLQRAAEAGLVHCVSNNQRDLSYICNCCTCSCGVLRGMVELGIANVVARSAFINRVDPDLCIACGDCVPLCSFTALSLDSFTVRVDEMRCVGCGVCGLACPQAALGLERRAGETEPPLSEKDWRAARTNN